MRRYKATREWGRSSAKSTSSPGRRSKKKWPKYVGLLLVLSLVFFFGRNIGSKSVVEISVPEQTKLDVGGVSTGSATVEDVLSGSVLSIPLDNAIVLDEEIADEANIAQDTTAVSVDNAAIEIALTPVGGTHGSGTSSIQFVDSNFRHVIVANLPDPPVGYFYEGWFLRSKPFDFFSTGQLIQHADDLKWYLLFEDTIDYSDYKKVVVTIEPEDGDPAPADHVLEGEY